MSEMKLCRHALMTGVLVLGGLLGMVCALDVMLPDPPGSIRHRSLRNRVECLLEKWGLIAPDPFRHVEG
jgi:hypothetical protein